jgi:hypothetical protein
MICQSSCHLAHNSLDMDTQWTYLLSRDGREPSLDSCKAPRLAMYVFTDHLDDHDVLDDMSSAGRQGLLGASLTHILT